MTTSEFAGKAVAIVCADQGVGPAIAAAFRDAGARVAVDAPPHGAAGYSVVGPAAPEAFFDAVGRAVGGLDVFVLSARPVRNKPFLDVAPAELREVVESDLVLPALLMQEAARRMAARKSGRIIALASMSAKTGAHHNVGPFAAAKGGLLALVRVMASELAHDGITVNGIATALFEPQVATMSEEKRTSLRAGIPVGRFGRSDEAAHAALFLASERAGFVTGEVLNLSGGRFMD